MTRNRTYEYFIERDNNYAEAILRALNDEYCLGIPDDSIKLVGGFGGGMGCGEACGALCGGCSAIGYRLIHERAHAILEPKPAVAAFAERFVEHFGLDAYCELAKIYKKEDTRCPDMIRMVADIASAYFERVISGEREQSR